jgi:hypothetical protein
LIGCGARKQRLLKGWNPRKNFKELSGDRKQKTEDLEEVLNAALKSTDSEGI